MLDELKALEMREMRMKQARQVRPARVQPKVQATALLANIRNRQESRAQLSRRKELPRLEKPAWQGYRARLGA